MVLWCPWLLWADGGLGIGVLGGALVGSLVGHPKNRVQNALIGAVAGGALTEMSRSAAQESGPGVVYRSAPANVVYESVTPDECRQMQTQGYIDGRQETLTGMACRAPGSSTWQYQEAPRVVQRSMIYQPQRVVVEQVPQTMTVYPSQTVVIEPLPMVAYPVVTVTPPPRGRYYGHRDVWREEHHRRLDW
jgi:surface antigen